MKNHVSEDKTERLLQGPVEQKLTACLCRTLGTSKGLSYIIPSRFKFLGENRSDWLAWRHMVTIILLSQCVTPITPFPSLVRLAGPQAGWLQENNLACCFSFLSFLLQGIILYVFVLCQALVSRKRYSQ